MLSKKKSRLAGAVMLAAAVVFLAYAITHPTASFPWSNGVTYFLYAVYLIIMVLLLIAPFKR